MAKPRKGKRGKRGKRSNSNPGRPLSPAEQKLNGFLIKHGLFIDRIKSIQLERGEGWQKRHWTRIAEERGGRHSAKQWQVQAFSSVLRKVKIAPTARVTSLGSGDGVFESFLAKQVCPQGIVTGIDFAHGMNKIARSIARDSGTRNARFITAASERVPIQAGSQNVVLSINHLQWIRDWKATVADGLLYNSFQLNSIVLHETTSP